jgi:hypothetical protein
VTDIPLACPGTTRRICFVSLLVVMRVSHGESDKASRIIELAYPRGLVRSGGCYGAA